MESALLRRNGEDRGALRDKGMGARNMSPAEVDISYLLLDTQHAVSTYVSFVLITASGCIISIAFPKLFPSHTTVTIPRVLPPRRVGPVVVIPSDASPGTRRDADRKTHPGPATAPLPRVLYSVAVPRRHPTP